MKSGGDLSGYSSYILNLGGSFVRAYGRWARKRGRTFEKVVCQTLEDHLNSCNISCWSYRAATQRCATQLYDIVIYLKNRAPIFIECKAGGIRRNSKGLRVDYNHRAMKNASDRHELLADLSNKISPLYYYVFPEEERLVCIPLQEILDKKTAPRYIVVKNAQDVLNLLSNEEA